MTQKFTLEFTLHIHGASVGALESSLAEFGESLDIRESQEGDAGADARNYKINIITQEPTAIFDICGQFGRIGSVKVSEVK